MLSTNVSSKKGSILSPKQKITYSIQNEMKDKNRSSKLAIKKSTTNNLCTSSITNKRNMSSFSDKNVRETVYHGTSDETDAKYRRHLICPYEGVEKGEENGGTNLRMSLNRSYLIHMPL